MESMAPEGLLHKRAETVLKYVGVTWCAFALLPQCDQSNPKQLHEAYCLLQFLFASHLPMAKVGALRTWVLSGVDGNCD